MLITDRKDDAVDNVALGLGKLSRDEVQDELKPGVLTVLFKVIFDRHGDDPLAALLVLRVLPLRSDAFTEHQVVRVGDDFRHAVEVVVHAPEVLD